MEKIYSQKDIFRISQVFEKHHITEELFYSQLARELRELRNQNKLLKFEGAQLLGISEENLEKVEAGKASLPASIEFYRIYDEKTTLSPQP